MSQSDLDNTEPPQLAEMLSIDPVSGDMWRTDELAAILQHQLNTQLRVDLEEQDDLDQSKATTFGELLHDQHPPLALLERAKRFAKACKNHPEGPLPQEVATALYFACIIAARIRCGDARMSALDDATQIKGMEWAVSQPWLDEALRQLFLDGIAHLKTKEA